MNQFFFTQCIFTSKATEVELYQIYLVKSNSYYMNNDNFIPSKTNIISYFITCVKTDREVYNVVF